MANNGPNFSSAMLSQICRRSVPAKLALACGETSAGNRCHLTTTTHHSCMEYTFTLKYQLIDNDRDPDALVERLGEVGCDDALVGIGLPGRLALEFTRDATDAGVAVSSALADVQRAMPLARLIEVAPDWVGLTDVADIIDVSRQNMRKLMLAHPESFPAPVHEGSASIWHLADVLAWLQAKGGYALTQDVLDVARAAWRVNMTKEGQRVPRG